MRARMFIGCLSGFNRPGDRPCAGGTRIPRKPGASDLFWNRRGRRRNQLTLLNSPACNANHLVRQVKRHQDDREQGSVVTLCFAFIGWRSV